MDTKHNKHKNINIVKIRLSIIKKYTKEDWDKSINIAYKCLTGLNKIM